MSEPRGPYSNRAARSFIHAMAGESGKVQRLRGVVRELSRLLEGRRVEVDVTKASPAHRYDGTCGTIESIRDAEDIAESGVLVYLELECRHAIPHPIAVEPHELVPTGAIEKLIQLSD